MARHVQLIDDIDGSAADRTFKFAVDGVEYELDLSGDNIREFNQAIAGFVESARRAPARVGRPRKERSNVIKVDGGAAGRAAEVRSWAKDAGFSVSEKGKLSAEVWEAFNASHRQAAAG